MDGKPKIYETIWNAAAALGLVQDYFQTEIGENDILDLVTRMLEADAISVEEAVGYINKVTAACTPEGGFREA